MIPAGPRMMRSWQGIVVDKDTTKMVSLKEKPCFFVRFSANLLSESHLFAKFP
jgi:hypothetical protein